MSLLARMLQKQSEQKDAGGEIPPGLVQSVARSANKGGSRTRYFLIAAIAVAVLVSGGLLVLYLQLRTPNLPVVVRRPAVAPPSAVQTTQPLPPQPQAVIPVPEQPKPAVVPPPVPENKVEPERIAVKSAPNRESIRKSRSVSGASAAKPVPKQAAPQIVQKKPAKVDRSTIDSYLFAARSAETHKDFVQAYKDYQKANEADPGNYRILNNLASTALHLDMYSDALSYTDRALAIKPDYVSALVNSGIANVKLGKDSAAKNMFSRAVELDRLNRKALYNLALLQERSNSLDEAYSTYRRLRDTGDSSGYLGLGRVFELRGQKSDALNIYRDLLGLPEAGQKARDIAKARISALE